MGKEKTGKREKTAHNKTKLVYPVLALLLLIKSVEKRMTDFHCG